jgi:hypothetical protein
MNTTNLFVELVVIGVGALVWIVLCILALFGYDWIPFEEVLSIPALVPILSIIYVLGIVFDRIADTIFEKLWGESLCKVWFKDRQEYQDTRLYVLHRSERLWNLMEYGRSRMRICRGWMLNSILIMIAMNIFVWTRLQDHPLAINLSAIGTPIILLLVLGSWYAWRQLSITECRKINEQHAFILHTDQERGKHEVAEHKV